MICCNQGLMLESRAIPLPSMTPRASASVCSNLSVSAWSSPCVRRARSAAFLKYGIACSISAGVRASLKIATA